jgi:Flp pilus assembly pilin Flp
LLGQFRVPNRKAQTTSEYVIILALVALGSIAIILLFGNTVRGLFGAGTKKISGEQVDYESEYKPSGQEVDDAVTVDDIGEAVSQP